MRRTLRHAATVASLFALCMTGCDGDEEPVTDYEQYSFRGGWTPPPDFWNWGIGWYAGNGALAIHEGTDTQAEDCIIWDILDSGGVHEGPADPGLPPFLTVVDNEIHDEQGYVECSASWEGQVFKLRDPSGDVVLSLWGRFMFDTDIGQMPPVGSPEYYSLLANHFVVELAGSEIYEGAKWKGNLIGTSTEHIQNANPMRKLLIGALVRGECGSNGPALPQPG